MGWRFIVTLTDDSGQENVYHVSMDKDFLLRIGKEYSPEKIVKKSFEFLLEKEPKEEILAEFDISLISHYYPDYLEKLLKKMDFD